jgi:hypothetical protein
MASTELNNLLAGHGFGSGCHNARDANINLP